MFKFGSKKASTGMKVRGNGPGAEEGEGWTLRQEDLNSNHASDSS